MRTVGQILKKARLEKGIGIEEVASATKIRLEYLQALEEDNFQKLPSVAFGRGFLKNYAEFLGLSPKPLTAIFRRDFIQEKKEEILPKSVIQPLGEGMIHWTPKLTVLLVTAIFFFGIFTYFGFQYFSLAGSPSLELISPQDGQKVSEDKIEVVGKTSPDALVMVNTNSVLVSAAGEFRYQLDLFPGENKIMIEVKNKAGKQTKAEISVFRLDKN